MLAFAVDLDRILVRTAFLGVELDGQGKPFLGLALVLDATATSHQVLARFGQLRSPTLERFLTAVEGPLRGQCLGSLFAWRNISGTGWDRRTTGSGRSRRGEWPDAR